MAPASGQRAPPAPDPVAVLRGHASDVNAVAFHPPTGTLLSGDADGEVKMWDLQRRRTVLSARLHGAGSGIIGLGSTEALGSTILSQGRDGVVKCWQLAEGGFAREPLVTVRTGSYHFCKLALLHSSPPLANAALPLVEAPPGGLPTQARSRPGSVPLWGPPFDLDTRSGSGGTEAMEIARPTSSGEELASERSQRQAERLTPIQPDGASFGRGIPESGASGKLPGETGASPDGHRQTESRREASEAARKTRGGLALALGDGEGGLAQERGEDEGQQGKEAGLGEAMHGAMAAQAGGSPTERACLMAVAGQEPSVAEVWDLRSGEREVQLRQLGTSGQSASSDSRGGAPSAGMCMALQLYGLPQHGSPLYLLAGYEDGSMAAWDVRSPAAPVVRARLHSEPVLSIAVDGPRTGGVSGAADDKVVFFNLSYDKGRSSVLKEEPLSRPGVAEVAVRADDRIVATGGWDHRVRVYDYMRRRALAVLKYHTASVTGVAFSPDRKILASCSRDASVALWSVYPPP